MAEFLKNKDVSALSAAKDDLSQASRSGGRGAEQQQQPLPPRSALVNAKYIRPAPYTASARALEKPSKHTKNP